VSKLAELIPNKQVLAKQLADPEVARIWQETEFADQVATMLIDYRARHRLSQSALARQLGMRQPAIARLESGEHTPSFRTLARLAEVLGLDLELRIMHDRFELTAEGHASADVLVLPGVPGKAKRLDDGRGAYPASTVDIMKLLREQKVAVEFVEPPNRRAELTYHAADIWLPVLLWTSDAVANGAGSLFAHAIIQLFGQRRAERSVLHVRCGRQTAEGDIRWFEADGPGSEVLKALREFDKE
jgi:transcriptional regulator with XRE-family HTH domain